MRPLFISRLFKFVAPGYDVTGDILTVSPDHGTLLDFNPDDMLYHKSSERRKLTVREFEDKLSH